MIKGFQIILQSKRSVLKRNGFVRVFNNKGCKIAVTELALITAKLLMRVDRRSQHGYGNCATLEGRELSVFVFQHDTVNLSFMYLSTEVKLMTSLITVFA